MGNSNHAVCVKQQKTMWGERKDRIKHGMATSKMREIVI